MSDELPGEPKTAHTDGIAEPLNIPATLPVTEALRVATDTWEIHMTGGAVETVSRNEHGQYDCTCGDCQAVAHVESSADARAIDGPAIHMGTPPKEAQRTRRHARCVHATIVDESRDHPCPECDALEHHVTEHKAGHGPGRRVVMTSTTCANCGHRLN